MAGVVYTGSKIEGDLDTGLVNAGGKIYFYEPNTVTLKDTYSDSALTTANANPVILDSAGRASIWLNGNYSTKETDKNGNILYTDDEINPTSSTVSGNYNLVTNGSFEDDSSGSGTPDGWDLLEYEGSTNGRVTDDQAHGAASMKFVSTGSGGGRLTTTAFFEAKESGNIEVFFSLKSSVVDVLNIVQILWYKADQTASSTASTTVYTEDAANPTSWADYRFKIAVPSDAAFAKLRLFGCDSSDATSGTTWFDNIIVTVVFADKGADVASANDMVLLFDGILVDATGTTQVNGMTTGQYNGQVQKVHFDGVVPLKHNTAPSAGFSKLWLHNAADHTTVADDEFEFVYDGTYWRVTGGIRTFQTADLEQTGGSEAVTSATIRAGAVDQAAIGAAAVGQGELKTTTGIVSTASTSEVLLTLPGGQYGFYPETRETGDGMGVSISSTSTQQGSTFGSFIIAVVASSGTGYLQQRYIQASPPYDLGNGAIPLFVFALIDNVTGDVISTYVAEDPPWANNGPTNIRPDFTGVDGKKYQKVKQLIMDYGNYTEAKKVLTTQQLYDRMINDEYVDRELTQAIKQADMPLMPHPFGDLRKRDTDGNDLGPLDATVVMLDPLGKLTTALQPLIHDGGASEIAEALHAGYMNIGNTDNGAKAPPGVMPVDVRFKL